MSGKKNNKILLVEDDALLRKTMQDMIATAGYNVQAAQDGVEASSVITLENFNLIISDFRMPNMNGVELLHFIKKNKPTPFILITGFADVSDEKEAKELGAGGFLKKPFEMVELLAIMKTILGEDPPKLSAKNRDEHFCSIRIDDFISGNEIRYDLYIRLSSSKYVKIAAGGETFSRDQIDRYKAKNVHSLFLTKEDFKKYVGFNLNLSKKIARADTIAIKKKVDFLLQASIETTKNLFVNEVDLASFEGAKDMVLTSLGVVTESPSILDMLEALRGHADHLYAHSLAVSIYATMIAKHVGWNSSRTAAIISMCGLFHDIGKKEIPQEILEKSRMQRTPEEIKIYESHTLRGMELINLAAELPEEVSQVALQHHENCMGLGYPMRLSKNKMQPIARLVALVDDFCNLIISNSDQREALPPSTALQKLDLNAKKYDEEFMNGLKKLLLTKK